MVDEDGFGALGAGEHGGIGVVGGFGGAAAHVVVGEADEDALAGLVGEFGDGFRKLVGGVIAVVPEAVGEEVSVGVIREGFVLRAREEVAGAGVSLAAGNGFEEEGLRAAVIGVFFGDCLEEIAIQPVGGLKRGAVDADGGSGVGTGDAAGGDGGSGCAAGILVEGIGLVGVGLAVGKKVAKKGSG